MNDILKQRLVGALVLIGLGVIFWPVVFVESERGGLDRSSQVEPMPVLEDVTIPAPSPLPDVAPVNPVQHAILPDAVDETLADEEAPPPQAPAETPASEPGETGPAPKLDEQGIPIAWVLQVVTVSSREKAETLTAELIAQGYKAYHRSMRRDGAVLYRVFVGPVFERDKLAAVKRDIDANLKVSAIIARYVP